MTLALMKKVHADGAFSYVAVLVAKGSSMGLAQVGREFLAAKQNRMSRQPSPSVSEPILNIDKDFAYLAVHSVTKAYLKRQGV